MRRVVLRVSFNRIAGGGWGRSWRHKGLVKRRVTARRMRERRKMEACQTQVDIRARSTAEWHLNPRCRSLPSTLLGQVWAAPALPPPAHTWLLRWLWTGLSHTNQPWRSLRLFQRHLSWMTGACSCGTTSGSWCWRWWWWSQQWSLGRPGGRGRSPSHGESGGPGRGGWKGRRRSTRMKRHGPHGTTPTGRGPRSRMTRDWRWGGGTRCPGCPSGSGWAAPPWCCWRGRAWSGGRGRGRPGGSPAWCGCHEGEVGRGWPGHETRSRRGYGCGCHAGKAGSGLWGQRRCHPAGSGDYSPEEEQ